MLSTIVTVVHVLVAFALIGIVLLQRGKGANIGASFGGSSQTMFGPRGPATALAKITTGAAIFFMVTSLILSVMANNSREESVMPGSGIPAPLPVELPEVDPSTAPEEGPTTAPLEATEPDTTTTGEEGPTGPTGG